MVFESPWSSARAQEKNSTGNTSLSVSLSKIPPLMTFACVWKCLHRDCAVWSITPHKFAFAGRVVLACFQGLRKARQGTFMMSCCGSALCPQPHRCYCTLTTTWWEASLSPLWCGELAALRSTEVLQFRALELRGQVCGGWGGLS